MSTSLPLCGTADCIVLVPFALWASISAFVMVQYIVLPSTATGYDPAIHSCMPACFPVCTSIPIVLASVAMVCVLTAIAQSMLAVYS